MRGIFTDRFGKNTRWRSPISCRRFSQAEWESTLEIIRPGLMAKHLLRRTWPTLMDRTRLAMSHFFPTEVFVPSLADTLRSYSLSISTGLGRPPDRLTI